MQSNWDYIIIGGGAAGCVLANRLSANPKNQILLLEAGGRNNSYLINIPTNQVAALEKDKYVWRYSVEPDETRQGITDMWPAGKGLGGGSAVNGMLFIQGLPEDYNHWASLGNQGWSYADIEPYDKKVRDTVLDENHGKIRHPHALINAFINACTNINLKGTIRTVSQRKGQRYSSARAYLSPIKNRKNLTILTHAVTTRLIIENKIVTGVEYVKNNKTEKAYCSKEVILSAGTLSTPKILMLSGIGAKAELEQHSIAVTHDLPGVGKNLQEHTAFLMAYLSKVPTLRNELTPFNFFHNLFNWLLKGKGPFTSPVAQAYTLIKTKFSPTLPDVIIDYTALDFRLTDEKAKKKQDPFIISAPTLCRPEARGCIILRSADAVDSPKISFPFFEAEKDLLTLVEAFKTARVLFKNDAFSNYLIKESLPGEQVASDEDIKNYIQRTALRGFHPVGTCKMGNDPMAVVDNQLRVYGIKNLRIADCSIMPTIVSVNTMVPAMTIAEKCADMVLNNS